MGIGTPAQQQLGKKFFGPFFAWADDAKLREWLREQDPDELEQFLNWFDFANHRDRETLGRQELRKLRNPTANLGKEHAREKEEIAGDEISEEGRKVRFAQWEKFGLDAIRQDLAAGGNRLVGGPPQVRALAREWIQMKEKGDQHQSIHANAFDLLKAIERATHGSASPVALEQLRNLQMTGPEAQAAFLYLKDKGWIQANFRIFYAARMSAAGHDAIKEAKNISIKGTESALLATADEPLTDAALAEIRATLATIKAQLPAVTASNTVRAEIDADVTQIATEADRPTPRRSFMKLYLESLRDNLARAAGAGTVALVAAVGGLLAKYFGVF
jgi:hypothetical protein